jgi:hypothetical protein
MDLRCPKCNSTDLKKVSLAHEEGHFRSEGRTRLSAVVAGSGGPDLVVGRATTRGTQQSALSKKLTPPLKWSYLKVIGWSVLVFLSAGWLVFYVNTVTTNATRVASTSLMLFGLISGAIFVLLLLLVWRHNHTAYQHRYAEWDRSFLCQRCGAVIQHAVDGNSTSLN